MSYKVLIFSLIIVLGISCESTTKPSSLNTNISKQKAEVENVLAESFSKKKKSILFFGDSLTAAHGLDPSDGYTTILQQRIDSLGLNYKVINAGNSGETTAGGKERIDWVIRQKVDIFVLELGANDGLRGIAPESTQQNLQAIIDKVKTKYPGVKMILAGMEAPPNMGGKFTSDFRNIFPLLAKKNDIELIPFFLEGVAAIPDLNLKDGIHPNKKGQKIVAKNVWSVLMNML